MEDSEVKTETVVVPNITSYRVLYGVNEITSESELVIEVKCPSAGAADDGYHTFDELYEHRSILFCLVLSQRPDAWKSLKHADGSNYEGRFIAGCSLLKKQISYHLPLDLWDLCHVRHILERVPDFDNHTSNDVVQRIKEYLKD